VTESERRLLQNETILRETNERFMRASGFARRHNSPLYFICECGKRGCTKHIALPYNTYEQIHRNRMYFLVWPGHVDNSMERIVQSDPRGHYMVVEKYDLS